MYSICRPTVKLPKFLREFAVFFYFFYSRFVVLNWRFSEMLKECLNLTERRDRRT